MSMSPLPMARRERTPTLCDIATADGWSPADRNRRPLPRPDAAAGQHRHGQPVCLTSTGAQPLSGWVARKLFFSTKRMPFPPSSRGFFSLSFPPTKQMQKGWRACEEVDPTVGMPCLVLHCGRSSLACFQSGVKVRAQDAPLPCSHCLPLVAIAPQCAALSKAAPRAAVDFIYVSATAGVQHPT